MSRDPPQKKQKLNDANNEGSPDFTLEEGFLEDIDVGSIGDVNDLSVINDNDDESIAFSPLFPETDCEDLLSSQHGRPLAFPLDANLANRVWELMLGAYRDHLLGIQLLDSPNVKEIRGLLTPEYGDHLVAVIPQLIASTESRNPRARVIIPNYQPPGARISHSNQRTAVSPQVSGYPSGKKGKSRGRYKCGRCGAPKAGHVCLFRPVYVIDAAAKDSDEEEVRSELGSVEENNEMAKMKGNLEQKTCDKTAE
ncbi:unnamed protein product [Cylindrotheca closterium]|uniref:Uncharacterized protein n=1 Tax=Cylindrotheca closterium TaxID=2856 RepID=A0AAD2FND4_9STRA|nr:unnamed protein product [Cylindrotheca closterium]